MLTDGTDTSSRLSPSEVSGIASGIDVPFTSSVSCRPSTTVVDLWHDDCRNRRSPAR